MSFFTKTISKWNSKFQITVIHAEAMTEFSSTAEQITDCQQQTTDVRKKQRTIVPTEKTVDVGRGSSICVRVSKSRKAMKSREARLFISFISLNCPL